ncbi:MAG: hypothetical protein ABIH82_06395 [Candidatus Woesearchaeota archaeon]
MQIKESSVILKFNNRFYSINAIISANTRFSNQFSTEVAFAMLNVGNSLYHQVKLIKKFQSDNEELDKKEIYNYVNEVLKYPEVENENNMSNQFS